jgi:hypothetical protein
MVSVASALSGSSRAQLAATVQLFSFSRTAALARRLVVRASADPWSVPLSLDAVGTEGEIAVQTLDGPAQLAVAIHLGAWRMQPYHAR